MDSKTRWCQEIETYRTIKSAFILEGDILDSHMWVSPGGYYSLTSLDDYLYMYLKEIGYTNIVFYNFVDGFYNRYDQGNKVMTSFYKVSGVTGASGNHTPSVSAALTGIRRTMVNTETPYALILNLSSLLTSNPSHMEHSEMENFASLLLAMQESRSVPLTGSDILNNVLFLVVNKANDLPAWLYMNNPYVKVVTIAKPDNDERHRIIEGYCIDGSTPSDDITRTLKQLVSITDGFTNIEIDRLMMLCRQENIEYHDYSKVINAYRYGQREDPWATLRGSDLNSIESKLQVDVKGQSVALHRVADVIKRAASGLSGLQHSSNSRPKGVLFFAGPTGTGKTELAKALARTVFGDESALIRFDMSEYGHEHSDQRLLGAPPGYVGYNEGGELTNAVKQHPFSILLFDEIEKAHPSIMDKFLQILDDGRMTDSKGETVYFTETILIFTSNKGMYQMLPDGQRIPLVTPDMSYPEMEETITKAIRDYFISELGRPEILNRIGSNLVVFNFIQKDVVPQILGKQVTNILRGIKENRNIDIELSKESPAWQTLIDHSVSQLSFGGRGVGNVVEKYLLTPLARKMTDESWTPGRIYRICRIDVSDENIEIVTE